MTRRLAGIVAAAPLDALTRVHAAPLGVAVGRGLAVAVGTGIVG
jgi:hypothetical protein